ALLPAALDAIDRPWADAIAARLAEDDYLAVEALLIEAERRGDATEQQLNDWGRERNRRRVQARQRLAHELDSLGAAIERAVQVSALDVRTRDDRADQVQRIKDQLKDQDNPIRQ